MSPMMTLRILYILLFLIFIIPILILFSKTNRRIATQAEMRLAKRAEKRRSRKKTSKTNRYIIGISTWKYFILVILSLPCLMITITGILFPLWSVFIIEYIIKHTAIDEGLLIILCCITLFYCLSATPNFYLFYFFLLWILAQTKKTDKFV
jgi:uncharacterized membrane protein